MPSNRYLLFAVSAALLALGGTACGSDGELAERQAAVAAAGADVMPFSLEATTHIFSDTPTGGRQDVVADDPADNASIEDVRRHLREEAYKFSEGDFSDPEEIHGSAMPGLATLKTRFDEVDVAYVETETGAGIIYTAQDPDLVEAIQLWFAAQTSDHGTHAEHNS